VVYLGGGYNGERQGRQLVPAVQKSIEPVHTQAAEIQSRVFQTEGDLRGAYVGVKLGAFLLRVPH
jgi:hypothetical protein